MSPKRPKDLDQWPRAESIRESSDLPGLLKKHKLNDSEFRQIRDIMGRMPSFAELGIFSAMWSEHCSYKSSRVHLKRFPTSGDAVIQGPGENAGIVRLHGKLGIAFKMESHNHPSYIEPYQGAATGVGGILRDVFCMGARPIANLNCLRFGHRSHPRTAYLLRHVVKGIGDYGNCVGIPTVGGQIAFDESYNGNCLVNAMTIGLIREDQIFKGYASGKGNLLIYVGSATGRDGIHGATMASDSFDSKDAGERAAVQVGDPFTEKLLMEATLEVIDKKLIIGLQDMGAAGLASSSFEMASRAGNGLFIDLDCVPTRTTSMSAYELMLSESQERMLMVAEPKSWDALRDIFKKWQLSYAVIGEVTDTGRVQATKNGILEIDVPVAPITDAAPKLQRPFKPAAKTAVGNRLEEALEQADILSFFRFALADNGQLSPVYRQYDRHIGNRSVLSSDHQGAAVLWIREADTHHIPFLGVAAAAGCLEQYCAVDAKLGAAHSVLRLARMLFAVGATPLAITDCLNFGNPEDPAVMAQFSESVDGISEACLGLNTPVVSGNVSLYNETDGRSIHPTPMIGMVGRCDDIRKARPANVQQGAYLYLLTSDHHELFLAGGSFAKSQGIRGDSLPTPQYSEEVELGRRLLGILPNSLAVRDVGQGGIATTILKMCLASDDLAFVSEGSSLSRAEWIAERTASYLIASEEPVADLRLLGRFKSAQEFYFDGLGRFSRVLLQQSYQASTQL